MSLPFSRHQEHMSAIRDAALRAADPAAAITKNLHLSQSHLHAGTHRQALHADSRILLIAFGKAASRMTIAAAAQLGDKLTAGVAAIPHQTPDEIPACVRAIPAGHPHPDEGSLAAGTAAARLLRGARPHDLVVVLISGGGSAMFELPRPGISLDDLRTLTDLMIRSGAPIDDVNTVRQTLSLVKAGGLARLAAPARCVALIMSDVVGDQLPIIASGPTVLRRAKPEAAKAVLQRLDLWKIAPSSVRSVLAQKPPQLQAAPRPINVLIGTNQHVIDAAGQAADHLGFPVRVITRRMRGEARYVGRRIASRLASTARPMCLLMGGETTVTVAGSGIGGRNQELALAASLFLDGIQGLALMSLATDGVDGPTDAAGALITGETAARMRASGVDPEAALADNDSHTALRICGALIRTGPTQTNLNDLVVGLAYA